MTDQMKEALEQVLKVAKNTAYSNEFVGILFRARLSFIDAALASGNAGAVEAREKEAFERWLPDALMPSEFSSSCLFAKDGDGDYELHFVAEIWKGWLGRALFHPESLKK